MAHFKVSELATMGCAWTVGHRTVGVTSIATKFELKGDQHVGTPFQFSGTNLTWQACYGYV